MNEKIKLHTTGNPVKITFKIKREHDESPRFITNYAAKFLELFRFENGDSHYYKIEVDAFPYALDVFKKEITDNGPIKAGAESLIVIISELKLPCNAAVTGFSEAGSIAFELKSDAILDESYANSAFFCFITSELYLIPPMTEEFFSERNKFDFNFYKNNSNVKYIPPEPKDKTLVEYTIDKQNDMFWFGNESETKKTDLSSMFKSFKDKMSSSKKMPKADDAPKKTAVTVQEGENAETVNIRQYKGSDDPDADIAKLVGLKDVKEIILNFQSRFEYAKMRAKKGLDDDAGSLHMCFTGNPGTGKTTVARIMTGILYNAGKIKENKCTEVSALELVGGYVGQTGPLTSKIIESAKSGVLFIDEAYALVSSGAEAFGREAIQVIVKAMEDSKKDLVVIFAGYSEEMQNLINSDPGLKSRVSKFIHFPDYTPMELMEMFLLQIKALHLKADRDVLNTVAATFEASVGEKNFGNGRFVRNLVERLFEQHVYQVVECGANTPANGNYSRMDTLVAEDIPENVKENLF